MKVKEALVLATSKLKNNSIEESTNKARRLLAFTLGVKKLELLFIMEKELLQEQENKFSNYIDEVVNGKPIQYILGYQEFMKINFKVNENVLIPQPDTETLVEKTIEIAKRFSNPKILDLCTGSGAIAISLSKYVSNAQITASDISKDALEIAKINDGDGGIKFTLSNLFENINERFDIIVSNPPYIKTSEILNLSKEVQNEPHIALDGGEDGLDFYRKIINNAYNFLNKDGYLCLEIGEDQKKDIIDLINESKKYTEVQAYRDIAENDRVIVCKKAVNEIRKCPKNIK